ncbi:Aste57867_14657 [Aphanomyces stellatus]|uniref:beta-glucosidase n=1 Tax=Aphanomyces stellatus TaxID=120398 RepID=A0A485L270_9STRA|nr:hypothetical protein As57867_014602 [Aphanomyces stellatus]VFT91476.1 Aste57867_14657 [Aphanomyces stellatus]
MNQISIENIQFSNASGKHLNLTQVTANAQQFVGSYFNNPGGWIDGRPVWNVSMYRSMLTQLQSTQLQHTNIPILFGLDSIHGANYIDKAVLFPQNINGGATFNPDLVQNYGKYMARDNKAAGIPWIFNPTLDITRHKHWPRVYETYGEDPTAVAAMAKAVVTGIQSQQVAACFKQFIGDSDSISGNDRDAVVLSDYDILNYFTPPFKAAIDAGVMTGMGTYVGINGVPLAINTKLHLGLLRHDLNFTGMLVSDWNEMYLLHYVYNLVPNDQDATQLSLNNGTYDMCMVPTDTSFVSFGRTLLAQRKIQLSRLQQSAQRILKLKLDLGLFDNPVPGAELVDQIGDVASQEAALAIARESIVLLKNANNTLPLQPSASVFLTGPSMDDIGMLCGGWTYYWQGISGGQNLFPHGQTTRQAMEAILTGSHAFDQGVSMDGTWLDINKAKQLASQHAYTVVVLGERAYAEANGNDDPPALPDGLITYVQALATTNTTIILVLAFGRPRLLHGLADVASAVLWAGLPCEMGGQAISEVLFGKVNPSGKLPYVYPKTSDAANMAQPYYFRKGDKCLKWGNVTNCPTEWPFGQGLSYTTFAYSNIQLSSTGFNNPSQMLTISVTIKNTGAVAGQEVVMLFVTPPATRPTAETKLLKKFTKIQLSPGQTTTVSFDLTANDWGYYLENIGNGLKKAADVGTYKFAFKATTDCTNASDFCRSFQYGDANVIGNVAMSAAWSRHDSQGLMLLASLALFYIIHK